jgi:type III restriction enzyme
MIQLKAYQHRVLSSLREFLADCARTHDPAASFERVTEKVYGQPLRYLKILDQRFEEMPYVCIRVPTGGGKTLIASHTVGIALNAYLPTTHAVVLWLVPSNTILDQTANALRDPRHHYRRALELECGGGVEVLTIEEALRMTRATVEGNTVVIVSTIQCFRTSDPEGRKVYDGTNSAMDEHIAAIPADRYAEMDLGPDGKPARSLINVLRHRRPVVIVDEAHNARTELSFATLANVRPSCIIEFTATPDTKKNPSNVLHRVSAAELKAENMVKLPLRVITRSPGQKDQLLAEAIQLRKNLEALALLEAQATGEYIRPILLIQVESVDACEPLRDRLANEFGLNKDEIKISVGSNDELGKIKDIAATDCPVRFILTVQKLREGWDCPFAYVLCTLRDTHSATAIEQIVGRILRLPGAKQKKNAQLNCSYALALSTGNQLEEVLTELRDALVSNGFTRSEAEAVLIPIAQGLMPLGSQPKTVRLPPDSIDVAAFQAHAGELAGKARIDLAKNEITVFVPLAQEDEVRLLNCVRTTEARAQLATAAEQVRQTEKAFGGSGEPRLATPYEQQRDFFIPLLCVREQGQLFEFEQTHLIEHSWKLSEKDASLPATYDPHARPGARVGFVDIGTEGKVQDEVVHDAKVGDFIGQMQQHVMAFARPEEWDFERLVAWLDAHLEHHDIPTGESAEFLRKCIRGVQTLHNIPDVAALALDRFRLREEIELRINAHRATERLSAFREWLLPASALTVDPEWGLDFAKLLYEPSWDYTGGHKFKKHYYGPKPGELHERKVDGSLREEYECALYLETLDEVEYWVRNCPQKPNSFRLQTSKRLFYPDFVCHLKDGRNLVVEFKGGNAETWLYSTPDAEEKRTVGAVWESRSKGRCLFIMPPGKQLELIRQKIAQSH